MNRQELKILLIEDNPGDVLLIRELLQESEDFAYVLTNSNNLAEGLELLGKQYFDILLLDLSLPDSKGLSSFFKVKAQFPGKPVIILTGNNDYALAKEAIKSGAQDFLIKGKIDNNLIIRSITYAIERKEMERKIFESEEHYRTLFELSPDAIIVIAENSIIFANRAAVQLLGAETQVELIGKNFLQFIGVPE
jgi:DNA-binding NarL/FixJ family response regulator